MRDAGAIRDADPMERAAHVQRLQGMAAEMKAMIGALNGATAAKKDDGGGNFDDDEEEEEEQLYVNIGAILNMNKGRNFSNWQPFYMYYIFPNCGIHSFAIDITYCTSHLSFPSTIKNDSDIPLQLFAVVLFAQTHSNALASIHAEMAAFPLILIMISETQEGFKVCQP